MFEKLIWHSDRMLLDDLVFRLEHYKDSRWELGDDCFIFYKIKHLVDQYAAFWARRKDFQPRHILELGVWDGGSLAFWFEYFHPHKHVGVDIQHKQDSPYFKQYVAQRGLHERLKIYWGTDQANAAQLTAIVKREFPGPLDLVIDDASHLYKLTKASFEILFPLLRPGGLYVIEDWAWGHWKEFQAPTHPWAKETPLTVLATELLKAAGSVQPDQRLIANLTVFQGFIVVERGELTLPASLPFRLAEHISERLGSS